MTTEWNSAQAGDTDPEEPSTTGEGAEHEGERLAEESGPEPTRERYQGSPWRGYTMPVPEHPEHAQERIRGAEESAAYDGITGYPDPSGAGAAQGGLQSPQTPREEPEGPPRASSEEPEPPQAPQKRSGRRSRPSSASASGERRAGGAPAGEDDPDNLAGWVGSLSEAADDTRIAGRHTGSFPVVRPDSETDVAAERPGEQPPGAPAQGAPRAHEKTTGEEVAGASDQDTSEPLPRRIPGSSPVSGAFRAVGADTPAPGPKEDRDGARDVRSRTWDTSGAPQDEDEYRPTNHDRWQPTSTTSRAELIERLEALNTLVELGKEDLPEEVLDRAGQLLDHAGARLRLSGDHTVVALAGGTGSGKSSLFNALSGLELSQTGVTRPTTSNAHACVWGHEGADALLSWLGVPTRYRHSRTGVLDTGDSRLTGLVLLDLPDHDSVRSVHTAEADRLIGSVDLLVWVLDPQKYADAAVHHRYLAKMAGHGAVTIAVLNQVDKVEPEELEELLTDLRRLLETESGVHPRVITTSTVTDHGIDELREFLGEAVTDKRALVDRLVADLDQVIEPFEEFHGEDEVPENVPAEVRNRIQEGLAEAAGVTAVADVVETNDVRRGKRWVGWPVIRRALKLRKDPLTTLRLDFLRRDAPGVGGPVDAHEAELETVLSEAADEVSAGMPAPWRRRMRTAARSGMAELPVELGEAVSGAVGDPNRHPAWWRTARAVQYGLLAVSGIGMLWALASLVSWIGGGLTGLRIFDDPVSIAYAGAVVVAALLVGWLTGVGCGNLVEVAAVQRREDVERAAQGRVRELAGVRVVVPMEEELARYRAFRAAYEVARPRG
ncbi:GTPase [Nocardiopsis alkaliphila]|uniref:GTPase n=1 Tax=Nocardiopsis alkaliphila TaxID=225762 RepID=UPI0003481C69|nr:YfjP family GTPase [Nocardiopsis alkaliphila]